MREQRLMSNPEIVRVILKKVKDKGSCTLEDLSAWFPENLAPGGGGYHPPDDFRQLIMWRLIDALDGSKSVKLDEIDDDSIKRLTFRLSDFALTLEDVLEISLTASPFFGAPQQFSSRKWADVFVLMPFSPEIDSLLNVQNAASSLGLETERADDENFYSGKAIIDDVWSGIYHAKFIVADCTGRNSNVFYEIGVAHTLGKPTILISQAKDDIPFDLQHLRNIPYKNTPDGMKTLERKLKLSLEDLMRD